MEMETALRRNRRSGPATGRRPARFPRARWIRAHQRAFFRSGGIDRAHPRLQEGVVSHGVLSNQQMKPAMKWAVSSIGGWGRATWGLQWRWLPPAARRSDSLPLLFRPWGQHGLFDRKHVFYPVAGELVGDGGADRPAADDQDVNVAIARKIMSFPQALILYISGSNSGPKWILAGVFSAATTSS